MYKYEEADEVWGDWWSGKLSLDTGFFDGDIDVEGEKKVKSSFGNLNEFLWGVSLVVVVLVGDSLVVVRLRFLVLLGKAPIPYW